MRFTVELIVEVDDLAIGDGKQAHLALYFAKTGVSYYTSASEPGDVAVQAFHFGGQQTQVRLVNLMPGQGSKEQPI